MSKAEYFVGTNIFLRFLTADVPDQAQAVDLLLVKVEEGKVTLRTSVLTIAEIVWTLESYYELQHNEVCDRIIGILNTPGLEVENSELIAQAMALYVDENIDFIDAYNGLWMRKRGLSGAITFDTKHFRRIPGISAFTPGEVG